MDRPLEIDPALVARWLRERQQRDAGTIAEWCADLAKDHAHAGRERESVAVMLIANLYESGAASADAVIDVLAGVEGDDAAALLDQAAKAADAALSSVDRTEPPG